VLSSQETDTSSVVVSLTEREL